MTAVRPCLQYIGSKVGMSERINALLGKEAQSYVEPFFGSGAVLLARPRAGVEVVNDINGDLIHFYRTLRDERTRYRLIDALTYTPYSRDELDAARTGEVPDDPVERARRFLVRSNQSYVGAGGAGPWTCTYSPSSRHSNASKWNNYVTRLSAVAERLSRVQIENTDARSVVAKAVKVGSPNLALYLDPPYVHSTRNGSRYAEDGFTDDDHGELLGLVRDMPGPVVISGYASDLYDQALTSAHGWSREVHSRAATSSAGKGSVARREEVLWFNAACHREEGDPGAP